MNRAPRKAPEKLTVYYNGACPVCRFEMERYQELTADRSGDFDWCDVSREPERAERVGLDWDTSLRRLHVVGRNGRMYVGLEAMLKLWHRLPNFQPLARLLGLPVLRPTSAWLYEHVVSWLLYRWSRARAGRRR